MYDMKSKIQRLRYMIRRKKVRFENEKIFLVLFYDFFEMSLNMTTTTTNSAASQANDSLRTTLAHTALYASFAGNMLQSLQLVRQLLAYYANWRAASRVFEAAEEASSVAAQRESMLS